MSNSRAAHPLLATAGRLCGLIGICRWRARARLAAVCMEWDFQDLGTAVSYSSKYSALLHSVLMGLIEFYVPMHSDKCELKVRKQLATLRGVQSLEIDKQMQKVTISGQIDAKRAIKKLRKVGKSAELWPQHQFDPSSAVHANLDTLAANRVYDHDYGYQQKYRPMKDDKLTTMFNEDNPNACSIM